MMNKQQYIAYKIQVICGELNDSLSNNDISESDSLALTRQIMNSERITSKVLSEKYTPPKECAQWASKIYDMNTFELIEEFIKEINKYPKEFLERIGFKF